MGQTQTAPPTFAQWLRAQIDERGWGVRTLARRMNPAEPEIARRALNRYLCGSLPTDTYRQQLADGLGIPVADVPSAAGPLEVALTDPFRGGAGGSGAGSDGKARGARVHTRGRAATAGTHGEPVIGDAA